MSSVVFLPYLWPSTLQLKQREVALWLINASSASWLKTTVCADFVMHILKPCRQETQTLPGSTLLCSFVRSGCCRSRHMWANPCTGVKWNFWPNEGFRVTCQAKFLTYSFISGIFLFRVKEKNIWWLIFLRPVAN